MAANVLHDWCSASGTHCEPLGGPTAHVEVSEELTTLKLKLLKC